MKKKRTRIRVECLVCRAPLPTPTHWRTKYCSKACEWRKTKTRKKKAYIRRYCKNAWKNMKEEKKIAERARLREYYAVLRRAAIKHYGGCCACCGEARIEFLAIDHINGHGNEHRRVRGTENISQWLKKHNYPNGFRVLCHNCNMSIGFYNYCPHNSGANAVHVPGENHQPGA